MRTDDSVEPPMPLVPHHPSPIGVSTETHADGELRNSHKERKCGETQLLDIASLHPTGNTPCFTVNSQQT